MLQLLNFGHMNEITISLNLCDKNLAVDVIDRNYDIIIFISKYLYFKKACSSHFLTSLKLGPCLAKQSLKTQKKLKK